MFRAFLVFHIGDWLVFIISVATHLPLTCINTMATYLGVVQFVLFLMQIGVTRFTLSLCIGQIPLKCSLTL